MTQDRDLRPIESRVITQEEMEGYMAARYKITTVVPLVDRPTQNTYLLDQDELYSFLEGYEEYAEFLVAIEKL
jgi:hypothetical protein